MQNGLLTSRDLFYTLMAKENQMSYKNLIKQVDIPKYTDKQETFNALSHMLGIPLALFIAIVGAFWFVDGRLTFFRFFGLMIFAISAFAVYMISYLYHGVEKVDPRKRFLRVLDHSAIYLLIAGTYTPICFVLLETNRIGLIILLIEWIGALIGIILNLFLFQHRWALIVSFILYLVMGWLCLYSGGFLYMPKISFAFVLTGGVTYTIGSLLYALGHKNMNFHSVFHIFVLLGTLIQSIGVLLIV